MTIASAIENAKNKIKRAYRTIENMGGTLPTTQNLENLPTAIESVNTAGSLIDGSVVEIDTNVTSIRSYAFANCTNLNKVILRSSTVVDLSDDTIFENTPIENKTGSIYVSDVLVNQYKLKTLNWSVAEVISQGLFFWEVLSYGDNKFVALSIFGYISTSTDGITWTTAVQNNNLSIANDWQDMIYNGTKFVALSSSGYISISTDGTTWSTATQNTNLGNHKWRTLAYGNNIFVALGYSGYISTSTDGEDWTTSALKLPLQFNWESIAYNNTEFIALSTTGEIYTSVDGINWVPKTNNLPSNNWQDMVYDGNEIIALSSYGNIAFSADSENWTYGNRLTEISNRDWESLSYDGSKFVALSRTGGYCSHSLLPKYNFLPISQLPTQ